MYRFRNIITNTIRANRGWSCLRKRRQTLPWDPSPPRPHQNPEGSDRIWSDQRQQGSRTRRTASAQRFLQKHQRSTEAVGSKSNVSTSSTFLLYWFFWQKHPPGSELWFQRCCWCSSQWWQLKMIHLKLKPDWVVTILSKKIPEKRKVVLKIKPPAG